MPLPLLRLVPFLLSPLILSAGVTPSPIADEAVAALMKLRSRAAYTWEISTLQPGDPALPAPPRTVRGAMTNTGDMQIEQTWLDGLVLETVSRRDGTTVLRTPEGWFSKRELTQFTTGAMKREPKWLALALEAGEPMTPEEQITRLLNDSVAWERRGHLIDMTLSERGASYWIGSGRLVPNATGRVQLRLENGLIRECRLIVEGDSSGAKPSKISFETVLTFDYYRSPPPIAEEATRKLAEAGRG